MGVSRVAKTIAPFALLGLAEILIFFNDPRHFFIADSLTWMANRHRSLGEFLSGFVQVDQGFWYRPLAQRVVESLLFPLAQLNPLPYRLVGFVLFFCCTMGVFVLAEKLTESRRIAWFSVLIFAPHLIHVFPTYDVAFTPELLFTLFYLGSTICYVHYLKTQSRRALVASVGFFVAGLLSKETAVALPFTLLAIHFLLPRKQRGGYWPVTPHFAVLGVYLVIALGFLHVRQLDFGQLVQGSLPASSDYEFGIGRHIPHNLYSSFSWAFGIPREIHGHWLFESPSMLLYLSRFRKLACLGAVCVLFTSRRYYLLLGIAWFLTTVAPTAPLVDHFLPYYLFAPLVGFAIALATVLDWACSQCRKLHPVAATACATFVLAAWTLIHANTANGIALRQPMLGPAAREAEMTVKNMLLLHPKLPRGAHVLVFTEHNSAEAQDRGGILLQLAYDDPTLTVEYVPPDYSVTSPAIAVRPYEYRTRE